MADKFVEFVENRSETRTVVDKDKHYSVELEVTGVYFVHQFKLWNMSSKGLCILIKEDSSLLKSLKAGDIRNMKYYTTDSSKPTEYLKTQIKHITKDDTGRFKGHYLVGLSILEKQDSDQ